MSNIRKSEVAGFSDKAMVGKSLQTSVMIEGKEVPIVHKYGRANWDKYPKNRVAIANMFAKINKVLGSDIRPDKFFGTEYVKIEKMKEIHSPGIGNNAVHKLACLGYNYRQIARKIGLPIVTEINIHHLVRPLKKGWLNLMLNEGLDEIWDLVTEVDATNYYTNALARVGVGNSAAAVVATQTALQGGSTAFAAMEATFPLSTTTARVDFKSSFADGVGEFAWEEFTVDNGSTPNKNLQRVLASKGTKSAGEVWTAEIRITGS